MWAGGPGTSYPWYVKGVTRPAKIKCRGGAGTWTESLGEAGLFVGVLA